MHKNNAPTGNKVALELEEKGVKPHTGFISKPSGTVAYSQPDQTHLQGGGNKGSNDSKRYSFKKSAFDSLVAWLIHGYKWPECRHMVFTLPEDEYHAQAGQFGERETEKYWQKQFKLCLELLRYHNMLKGYCWVKERQKNGVLHWHVIHNGFIDYKKVNDLWSQCIRKSDDSKPRYPNCLRTKEGFSKLQDQSPTNVAAYFGKYFVDGKGYYFYTKAYRIEPLPDPVANGKVKLGQAEFDSVRQQAACQLEHATIYRTNLEEYARIINQRTEPEHRGPAPGPPDFSKCSGGLIKTPYQPLVNIGLSTVRKHWEQKQQTVCKLLSKLAIYKSYSHGTTKQQSPGNREKHRTANKAGEREQAAGKQYSFSQDTLQFEGPAIRSIRTKQDDPKRLCSYKDLQGCLWRVHTLRRVSETGGATKAIPGRPREG